jgi:hypothetical protein
VLNLAREERLTAYDATYVELAMRLGIPLASKDVDLCDPAERLGVSVLRASTAIRRTRISAAIARSAARARAVAGTRSISWV